MTYQELYAFAGADEELYERMANREEFVYPDDTDESTAYAMFNISQFKTH